MTETGVACEHNYSSLVYCARCGAREGCPALYGLNPDDGCYLGCGRQPGHEVPHHDPGAHCDWVPGPSGRPEITERRPYVCTWSQTGYADGVVRINPDQPPCPVCEAA